MNTANYFFLIITIATILIQGNSMNQTFDLVRLQEDFNFEKCGGCVGS